MKKLSREQQKAKDSDEIETWWAIKQHKHMSRK